MQFEIIQQSQFLWNNDFRVTFSNMGGFYYNLLWGWGGHLYPELKMEFLTLFFHFGLLFRAQNGNFDPFFHFKLLFWAQNGNFDCFFHFGLLFRAQNGIFICFFHFELFFRAQNGNFDPFFHFELLFRAQNGNFACFFHFEYGIIIKNILK